MRLTKFFVYFLFVLLIGSCFSVFLLGSAQVDSSVLSMSGNGWFVKVDSSLQTSLDSKAVPFTTVSKAGVEKELFLTLNSLKDCVSGQIEFKVSTQGLSVYKQLPLDKELNITEYDFVNATVAMRKDIVVVSRPESVVNSFACFDDSGKKVLHIYASKLVDAKGSEVWVDSDLKDGLLTVYLDQKWLDNAVFPVIIDPTFGYTSIPASSSTVSSVLDGSIFETPSDCQAVDNITYYCSSAGGANFFKGAIYTEDGDKIGETVQGTAPASAGWVTVVFASPLAVSPSTNYVLCAGVGNEVTRGYDSGGLGWRYGSISYPTLPSSISFTDGGAFIIGIYANYTGYVAPTPTPTPSPIPSSTSITDGELSFSFLFVLGFMVSMCILSLIWFVNTRGGAFVGVIIGLFTVLIGLYAGLGGVYSLGVVQGWFSLFVALFGGLTMLLVGLGVRVKR